MKNAYLIISSISFLTNIALCIYILYKNPKNRINQVFSLWAFSVSVICLGDLLRKTSTTEASAILWSKFMLFGVALLMPTLFHFALLLKPKTTIKFKYFTQMYHIPSVVIISLLFTSLLVSDVEYFDWRYSITWGPLMGVFGAIFAAYMMAGIFVLMKKVWSKKPEKYLFFAFGAFVVIGLGLNFIPSFEIDIPTISPLAMFASSLFAYLVIKNKYVIISSPESDLESNLKYDILPAQTYLIMENKVELSYSVFVDQVTHGKAGLILTRSSSKKIRERYELIKTPIFWLSNIKSEGNVNDLQDLTFILLSFLETKENNKVVLLDGIEYLVTQNGFLNTLKALHFINDYVMKNEAIMIVQLYPSILEEQQIQLLQTEMKVYRPPESVDVYTEEQPIEAS